VIADVRAAATSGTAGVTPTKAERDDARCDTTGAWYAAVRATSDSMAAQVFGTRQDARRGSLELIPRALEL